MVTDAVCVAESGGGDMDLAYVSEIDPTWNSDTLAMYTHPEAVLFSNPIAIASCMADAAASTIYKPIPMMFWCHGAHGHAYPFTGNNNVSDPANSTSSAASRALAALHRRGIAKQTYGTMAVCRDHPNPTLPRQQYRLQTMFPIPGCRTTTGSVRIPQAGWEGSSTSRRGRGLPLPGLELADVLHEFLRRPVILFLASALLPAAAMAQSPTSTEAKTEPKSNQSMLAAGRDGAALGETLRSRAPRPTYDEDEG